MKSGAVVGRLLSINKFLHRREYRKQLTGEYFGRYQLYIQA